MPFISSELVPYLSFALPPLIGAFIGYLTNRVAIRMLFRPLKEWRIFGIRIPMTPGVIPSKRHDLALNIGEMVGEHLLTGKEVANSLEKKKFQQHLSDLIEKRVEGVLQKDRGPIVSQIPEDFRKYYETLVGNTVYHLQVYIHSFIHSDEFLQKVHFNLDEKINSLLLKDIDTFLNREARDSSYDFIKINLKRMMASTTMEQWVSDFVHQKVHGVLIKGLSCEEILPPSLNLLLIQTIEEQTPGLLVKFAAIIKEPDIQEKIVTGVKEGVDNFIESLGPMSNMVNSFLSTELVEEKVKEYLMEKEDDIVDWLQDEDVQRRVAKTIRERAQGYLQTPISSIIAPKHLLSLQPFCATLTAQILAILREEKTTSALTEMVRDNIEIHLQGGSITVGEILEELIGNTNIGKCKTWLNEGVVGLLRSEKSLKTIDSMVHSMIYSLLTIKIGQLSKLILPGVRERINDMLQKNIFLMLTKEIPSLVESLNLSNIVSEKIDSLDLLNLERLLLSIMEEQFKYINLFGALLGFLIGCGNLLILFYI